MPNIVPKSVETPEILYVMADEKYIGAQDIDKDIMVKSFVAFEDVIDVSKNRRKLVNRTVFSHYGDKSWIAFMDFIAMKHKKDGTDNTIYETYGKYATEYKTAQRDGIENAINEAIKGEHLKTELITNVSHDLKTPLTSIINYVSLLKMGNIEGEEEKKYIDILDEKSKKLKRLIEDLTEASKANSGNIKMNVAQVNLNEMALQAVGENSDVLENAGLDVILTERDKEIIVNADSQHTFRIIDNLFSNAKKYSLTGTRVYVDVYKENGFGVFEIKNISKEKLNIDPDELTERFVRGDNSRTTDGSGLGLSIARSFAELQNGIFNIEIDGDMFKAVVKLPLI